MKVGLNFMLLMMFFCFTSMVKAQDIIVRKDGTTIKSKVEKVTDTVIEYKKYTNLNGPTYTIKITELLAINYENGETETFRNDGSVINPVETDTKTGERRLSDAQLMDLAHSRQMSNKPTIQYSKMDSQYKKGKGMKIAGYVVGSSLLATGVLMTSIGFVWNEEGEYLGIAFGGLGFIGTGLAVGLPLIGVGHHKTNNSKRIQSTSLYQHEVALGNNTRMTADINIMQDNLTRQFTPALGFHLNF